jgi:lipoate-protein ligase A
MRCSPPAVVLGGAQPEEDVDPARAALLGYQVARRRSGGGAVLVGPHECVWIDLVVPAEDPLWDPDVTRGVWWVGEVMATAAQSVGVAPATIWRGAMLRSRWSAKVCFSGRATGEVLLGSRKVVGVSQRRTRQGALIQTATLCRWRPADLIAMLFPDERDAAVANHELADAAFGIGPESGPRFWDAIRDQLMP